jgi:FixJ family two-component response regulator
MIVESEFIRTPRRLENTRLPPIQSVTTAVFVVDNDCSAHRSLEVASQTSGWRVETFGSAEEFLSRPPFAGPCCLVLNITLEGLNGLELQKRLAADRAHMPIVLVTDRGDVLMTVQAVSADAVSFLSTPFDDDGLSSAIEHAIERSELALRHEHRIRALQSRHNSLSKREREVMVLVASGLLNKQVSYELGISESTVKAHRGRVMRKMKAGSLSELVKMTASLQVMGDR